MPPEKRTTSCRQEEDRISQLPDEILLLILSRLGIQDAAATTILSKRWRHLFYFLPCLQFSGFYDYKSSLNNPGREYATIAHVLCSRRCPLKRCKLYADSYENLDRDMHRIMHLLCEHGLEDLSISSCGKNPYTISSHMFSCRTLTTLYLYHCTLSVPPEFTGLRSLRTLELNDVAMMDEEFEMMVSTCWALENLIIYNAFQIKNLVIRSSSLSRLDVITHRPLGVVVQEAPCLDSVAVSYSYHEADVYWNDVANTEFYHPEGEIVESDSEDSVDSEDSEDEEVTEVDRFMWLVMGLGHIETLKLEFDTEAAECLEFQGLLLVSLPSEHLFMQLKKLDLKMHFNDRYLAAMLVSILNGSPNLEEIKFEMDKFHEYTEIVDADYWDKQIPSECVRNRLKTFTLYFNYWFKKDCISFPKFLLMNATALEKMRIIYALRKKKKSLFSLFQEELFSLQKASPDAVLEFIHID
ncbi:putative F-box/FBD/LRR-repeat protein At4g13965 [Elaeis guineensis]|uniref:F-box/FBD/LRR-repeat protein At4g13965 n=1 Tax=Elaeis guineensis var. tenera TaxID=51953 RepID=A0A6I9R344_ELAGV|nr:putative F-box/FBD/LRR-repeat protein At4g13965 [Elaeis guineensis]XP_010918831.1 putative F-box/FBD/LRR-repeat protein At4g13965 [Elaeis guineensis]